MRRNVIFGCLGFLVACVGGLASPPEPKPDQGLVVPFLEGNPKVTGEVDESVWERAAETIPFALYKTGASPRRSTRAQIFYDAENLYIRLICEQPKSTPLKTIVNQEGVDAPVFQDDSVEVFLSRAAEASVFHLAASARSVRFDEVNGHPEAWNGRWLVSTSRSDDHWKADFVVPFEELARLDEPAGTPTPGSRWWMNLARSESQFSEWSQWNVSRSGFAERERFLPITFGERPPNDSASVQMRFPAQVFAGQNKATVEVNQNVEGPLLLTVSLLPLDREEAVSRILSRRRLEAPEARSFTFPVPVETRGSGTYRLQIRVDSADKGSPLAVDALVFETLDPAKSEETLRHRLDKITRLLETLSKGDATDKFRVELGQREKRFYELVQKARAPLDLEAGRKLMHAFETQSARAEELFRSVQKRRWQQDLASEDPSASFCVGIGSPFDHVFAEDLFSGTINGPIHLRLARNESEATQMVIIPLTDKTLKGVRLEISPLTRKDAGAVIQPEQWRIGKVGYIESQQQTFDETGQVRHFWPDVFLPPGSFEVSPGTQQPVFLRLTVPANQPPGVYEGTLRVAVGEETQTVPVEVEVWDFALPETPTLRGETWMHFLPLMKFYGLEEISLTQYERILHDFDPFRLSIYPGDYIVLAKKIKLLRKKDGSLGVDFSAFDPYIDLALSHHANAINLNFGLSGWITAFAGGWGYPMFTITDEATGVSSPYPAQKDCHWPAEELLESPDFIQFWKALWQHAKEKGWDRVAYVEDVDEPNDGSRKEELIRRHKFFRQHCPGLPLLSFGPTPASFPGAVGLIDIWAPILRGYESNAEDLRKRQEAGDRLWIYTCGDSDSNSKGETPDTLIDRPLIGNRILPLMAWKFGAEGLFNFTFNSFESHQDLMEKGAAGRWGEYPIQHAPETKSRFGISNLTWPGPEKAQLLPSLRLEMIREGREDHEYLAILRKLTDQLAAGSASRHADLLKESEALLTLPESIVANAHQWCHDPKELMEWRERLVRQILKLKVALAK